MDIETIARIFRWMGYLALVAVTICAGILVALIVAIWSWSS